MIRMSRLAVLALGASTLIGLAAFTGATKASKTITVVNKTTFNVDRIFLSPVEEKTWGDDILGDTEILEPGDQVDIEIDCGEWDVKLVAEDESTCELAAVDICSADTWEITADCGQ
ncbi:MAG TPA: hypothetical protein VNA88_07675 [Candidatus Kapabacteria bacterium]|jgi:hypothetical protein|nr:hypothetical protein [Candidatus Kapabacteria bacterium]